jgi:hypothetical protein
MNSCVCRQSYSRLLSQSCNKIRSRHTIPFITYVLCSRARHSDRAVKEMDSKSIGLCPQGFGLARSRLMCFAMWSCLSTPMREHIHRYGVPHTDRQKDRPTDRHRLQSRQTHRTELQTERQTDRQHTRKHLDKNNPPPRIELWFRG